MPYYTKNLRVGKKVHSQTKCNRVSLQFPGTGNLRGQFLGTGTSYSSSGIYIRGENSLVSDCIIRDIKLTTSNHQGVGMRIRGSDAHVTRCVFSNIVTHANTQTGGALAVDTDLNNVIIDNSLFIKCTTDTYGSSATATHAKKNKAAAAYIASGLFINNTIVKCGASACGGVMTSGKADIRNCLFFGNESTHPNYGGSYANASGNASLFSKCVSDVEAINEKCLLGTPESLRFTNIENNDFTFDSRSIAVNIGEKPLPIGVSPFDLNGNPRVVDRGIDAGCFENQVKKHSLIMVR